VLGKNMRNDIRNASLENDQSNEDHTSLQFGQDMSGDRQFADSTQTENEEGRNIEERRISSENAPPRQTPVDDIIYYYEIKTIIITNISQQGVHTGSRQTSDTTYYSYNERELTSHRDDIIRRRSGNNTFLPTIQASGLLVVIRPVISGSQTEYHISTIQSAQRPSRIPRPRNSTFVENLPGTFLENSMGRRSR
jgi:hypothetical protein